jgi:very-short-patch-repair endonuclease
MRDPYAAHRGCRYVAGTSTRWISWLRGLPVTALPLTVLDAAAALGNDSGRALVDRALQRRMSFAELHAAYCRSLGRHGSPWLGRLLQQAADQACSQAERVLHRLLRRARIVGWVANYKVVAGVEYILDVAVVEHRLAIEVDGWAWHSDIDRFTYDRHRQNALVLEGWTVLRFTWHDLTARPEAVIAQIRAALRLDHRLGVENDKVCHSRHPNSDHGRGAAERRPSR